MLGCDRGHPCTRPGDYGPVRPPRAPSSRVTTLPGQRWRGAGVGVGCAGGLDDSPAPDVAPALLTPACGPPSDCGGVEVQGVGSPLLPRRVRCPSASPPRPAVPLG